MEKEKNTIAKLFALHANSKNCVSKRLGYMTWCWDYNLAFKDNVAPICHKYGYYYQTLLLLSKASYADEIKKKTKQIYFLFKKRNVEIYNFTLSLVEITWINVKIFTFVSGFNDIVLKILRGILILYCIHSNMT